MTNKAANGKRSRQLYQWWQDGSQPDEDQSEQQHQWSASHSSDNAGIVRCLTPFSHIEINAIWWGFSSTK